MSKIISEAPGRICLFGDHQDYLSLPIIACSIDRFMRLEAIENDSRFFEIIFSDIDKIIKIPLKDNLRNIKKGDYLKAALKVLERRNIIATKGFRIIITSNIPINSGLSSSSALTIVWINFLLAAFWKKKISPTELAQLAYETEVIEQKTSGGKMDHFSISLGDTIYLNTRTDKVKFFKRLNLELIIGVSGIKKDTYGGLARLKSNTLKAIKKVQKKIPNFKIEFTNENNTNDILNLINYDLRPYLYAAIKNHSITLAAKKEFQKKQFDQRLIGKLMDQHHLILKNHLKTTTPLIDKMVESANKSGALGCKIVGSGGGGCIVALGNNNKKKIINSMKKAGAKDAFSVNISKGVKIKICK